MKKLKEIFDNFLKKLAKANQDQFGNERLDCCNLERPSTNKK